MRFELTLFYILYLKYKIVKQFCGLNPQNFINCIFIADIICSFALDYSDCIISWNDAENSLIMIFNVTLDRITFSEEIYSIIDFFKIT